MRRHIEINVETFKDVVQPSGFVNSRADIGKAVSLAHSVNGVTAVKNDMRLKSALADRKPGAPFAMGSGMSRFRKVIDAVIRMRNALYREETYP